ncbi:MAG: hypothetical protein AMXMBFR79_18990 [Chitinophagaceae bacterium]|nr:hypothetical protein [Chitinophagales bacterium]
MKSFISTLIFSFISFVAFAQVSSNSAKTPDPQKKLLTVIASCGECNFNLEGDDCDLAIMIDGKAYYVDGATINDFGHPHAKGGFCVAKRKAEVQGEIINGRFKATYFKLLKLEEEKTTKPTKQ